MGVTNYISGDIIPLVATFLSQTGEAPTITGTPTVTVKVYSTSGDSWSTLVNAANMTLESGSRYFYEFDTTTHPSESNYSVSYDAVVDGLSVSVTEEFRVNDSSSSSGGSGGGSADVVALQSSYATTRQVFEYLNWFKEVPEFVAGSTPVRETVASSVSAASIVYLDHNRVIDNTYTLYYGSSATTTTSLTETTHYTIDLSTGKVEITSSGATLINGDNVYAEYWYVDVGGRPGFSDSYVSDMIDRATVLIDKYMNRTYQSRTQVIREELVGKGRFARRYRPRNLPWLARKTSLSSSVSDSDTTWTVGSTDDLAAGDYLTCEGEVVLVSSVNSSTGLTVTRAQLGTSASAHSADVGVINFVVEVSTSPVGSAPSFSVLSYPGDFDVDSSTSTIQLLHNDITADGLFLGQFPEKGVQQRVRLTYPFGASGVPVSVVQACITQVARWLSSSAIAKGLIEGVDGFVPRADAVLSADIKAILDQYRLLLADAS